FANCLILSRSLEAMERGLSLSLTAGDDFVLNDPAVSEPGVLASTVVPTQVSPLEATRGVGEKHISSTEATLAYSARAEAPPPAPPEPDAPATRFTKVGVQREERTSALGEALSGLLAPQTLALVLGLAALVGAGWYLMRPESADALYAEINAAAAE